MLILGIESTCDETAAAVVRDGAEVLGQEIASSAEIHKLYGGVFPEMACRRHIDAILPVVEGALRQAQVTPEELDGIAVARGPGLIGALLIGLQAAKGLSIAWQKPLIGVNHIEAHLYAAMMGKEPLFPALGFVLSGGHTLMLRVLGVGHYELLGSTVDDAIGEAFDKVASLLGLSYPGGPEVERLALGANERFASFSSSKVKKNPLAFSFSGLKTAVLYALKETQKEDYSHLAASFQRAAFEDLLQKAALALQGFSYKSLLFGGGVCNNKRLRELFAERFPSLPQFWPSAGLSLDNAAMIAGLGFHRLSLGQQDSLDLEALARVEFWTSAQAAVV